MNLYLKTDSANEFLEVNQYLGLSGVLLDLEKIADKKADMKEVLASFEEYMADDQILIIPTLATRFRNILTQARELVSHSAKIRPLIPATTDGCMAIKACHTLKLPVLMGPVVSAGQLILLEGLQTPFMLDLRAQEFHNESASLLKSAAAMEGSKKNWIVNGLDSESTMTDCLEAGLKSFCLTYRQFSSILLNSQSLESLQELRERWVVAFLKEEFF